MPNYPWLSELPSLNVSAPAKPFQVGDIVRHPADAPGCERQVVEVISLTEFALSYPSGPQGSRFRSSSFELIHRLVLPRDISHMPMPALSVGMAGMFPDPEFCEAACDAYVALSTACGPHEAHNAIDYALVQLNWPFAVREAVVNALRTTASSGSASARLFTALTARMNHLDPKTKRCLLCADIKVGATLSAAACSHFQCASCARVKSGAACAVCSELRPFLSPVCQACCTHSSCPGCKIIHLRITECRSCRECANCCVCPPCEIPNCRVKAKLCCGGCDSHCECGTRCMRHTGMKDLHKWLPPPEEKGFTRLLGTEIETYGSAVRHYSPKLRAAVGKWKASVVTDGSIGGRGCELVTQPAGGSEWVKMITELGEGFKESQSVTSDSCGLHMHVDCTDVDAHALKRIIQVYAHVEYCLYDALPVLRQTGQYSKPNGARLLGWLSNDAAKFDEKLAAGEAKARLAYIQYGITDQLPKLGQPYTDRFGQTCVATEATVSTAIRKLEEIVISRTSTKGDLNRYSGLNMHSYWLRGTLEFRHHHGTNDPKKIINWGYVCGSIVEFCVNFDQDAVHRLLSVKPRDAMRVLLADQPGTMAWLASRWDKFTTSEQCRRAAEPEPDSATGEV